MTEVTLKINNRGYSLSCDPGQEQRLVDLSYYVDSRLKDIASAGAATNEAHLLVLTALVLADEVYDLREQVAALQDGQMNQPGPRLTAAEEDRTAQVIEHLARKVEVMAARLKKAA